MPDLLGVEHLSKRTVLVYGRVIAFGEREDIRSNTQVRDTDLGEQEAIHG